MTITATRGRLGTVVFILCGYRSSQKSKVFFLQEKGRMDMRGNWWVLPVAKKMCGCQYPLLCEDSMGTGIIFRTHP